MKSVRYYIAVVAILLTSALFLMAQSDQKELVIAQMNSCVNTLTNIINNQSMAVLEHESDQLLNNLTVKHMVGLDDIAQFEAI